jgi:glycosyltransferase involved in cell wall biosynthesis
MRVLIAGHSLGEIGGVQTYERDLASWLLRRGHSPIVYGTELGAAAREMTARTIPITDDLRTITAPIDVIHGDSPIETMAALLHFPNTPALFVLHGWGHVGRTTPRFPRILRYVAVDKTCADRLELREGIEPDNVSVLFNAVDVNAFQQRAPLPPKPRRAVVLSNLAHDLTFLPVIREACRRAAIEVDVVGAASGTATVRPETILGDYDVAFAKAKSAMEAMACGLAVILCDSTGLGGMVRADNFDRLRPLNFGIRTLQKTLSAEAVLAELALYDPDDARQVSDRIRATASSDVLHESLLALYESVIEEHARRGGTSDALAEGRAAAAFLHDLAIRDRHREARHWELAKAAQRAMEIPVIGAVTRRVLRRLLRR